MHDPEQADSLTPEPSPEATLRLPTGLPEDPAKTMSIELPKHLTAHDTQKLPLPALAGNPDQAGTVPRVPGDVPPIRLQKLDLPAEAEGRTQKGELRSSGSKGSGWKLSIGLGTLVVLGVVAYVLISRRPVSQPVAPATRGTTIPGGPEQVPPSAKVYFEQAQAGDAHAMRMLGAMYYYGLNVPADRDRGLYWYRKAAEKGSDTARAELSKIEGGR